MVGGLLTPLRVLALEPDRASAHGILAMLRGHTVDVARDPASAAALLREASYDALIAELRQPPRTLEALWEGLPARLRVATVFVTGGDVSPAVARWVSGTGVDVLLKPFRRETLHEALSRALRAAVDGEAAQAADDEDAETA